MLMLLPVPGLISLPAAGVLEGVLEGVSKKGKERLAEVEKSKKRAQESGKALSASSTATQSWASARSNV